MQSTVAVKAAKPLVVGAASTCLTLSSSIITGAAAILANPTSKANSCGFGATTKSPGLAFSPRPIALSGWDTPGIGCERQTPTAISKCPADVPQRRPKCAGILPTTRVRPAQADA